MGRPRFIPIRLSVGGKMINALDARLSKFNRKYSGFTAAYIPRITAGGCGTGPGDSEQAV